MSELTPSLCSCGHDEKHHHDGTGTWAKGCNQPLAMELGCPCKSFTPVSDDLEAREDAVFARGYRMGYFDGKEATAFKSEVDEALAVWNTGGRKTHLDFETADAHQTESLEAQNNAHYPLKEEVK